MDLVESDSNFNVYVGSETGVLKGVYYGSTESPPHLKNFHSFDQMSEAQSIISMSWADETQKDILVAFKTPLLKIYNTKVRSFMTAIKLPNIQSEIVGLHAYKNSYLVGLETGEVRLWELMEDKSVVNISTGKHLAKILPCSHRKSIFATGGKENDLQLWDLESSSPTQPIFQARNLPHDELDLRVPVWVQDIAFLSESTDLVAVGTRYGQLRLYDTLIPNRRPVINLPFMDHPLMAVASTHNNRQVIVGSAKGKVGLVDLRNRNKGVGHVVHHFLGFTGSVRSIASHPQAPYFVSCGLDRHLYLHHLHQKSPLKKSFLKSRLNCVLMADHFNQDFSTSECESREDQVHWQNIDMEPLDTTTSSDSKGTIPTHLPVPRKKRFSTFKQAAVDQMQLSLLSKNPHCYNKVRL